MSDDLIDRLTAAFLGHADHVDRNLFGRARDALQAQAAEIERLEAKLGEAVEMIRRWHMADLTGHDGSLSRARQASEAFLATMEKPHE